MKKLLLSLNILTVFWIVVGFDPLEIREAVCTFPNRYLLRFINCSIEQSPLSVQKVANLVHDCIETFSDEDKEKLESIKMFVCDDSVNTDEQIKACVLENSNSSEITNDVNLRGDEFYNIVNYCLQYG